MSNPCLTPASWNTLSTILALLLFSSSQLGLVLLRRLRRSLLPWSYFHRGFLGLRQHTVISYSTLPNIQASSHPKMSRIICFQGKQQMSFAKAVVPQSQSNQGVP